jgi:hypothetical protein
VIKPLSAFFAPECAPTDFSAGRAVRLAADFLNLDFPDRTCFRFVFLLAISVVRYARIWSLSDAVQERWLSFAADSVFIIRFF